MLVPVKASAGALVRDPHTKQPFPHLGGDEDPVPVDDTDLHWARLLDQGDLVRTDTAPARRSARKDEEA
jgi:hypothetical protein